MLNISQGKPLLYNVVHLMRLDIKRYQFKSDKRPWFRLMHVKKLVTCLLGVKQISPTDKGYAPKQCFLFKCQHNENKQIIHNSKKHMSLMVNRNIVTLIMYLYETNPSIYLIKFICL